VPHPSVGLLCADYPIVAIWRGALDGDDAAIAAVALDAGPSRLGGAPRHRDRSLDEAAWCFAAALFDGWSVEEALAGAAGTSADALLAEHLAAGLALATLLTIVSFFQSLRSRRWAFTSSSSCTSPPAQTTSTKSWRSPSAC
jgi:hypothetical protein